MTGRAILPFAAVLMLAWPAAARDTGRHIMVPTCNGGQVRIPLDREGGGGGSDDRPCVSACHAPLPSRKRSV